MYIAYCLTKNAWLYVFCLFQYFYVGAMCKHDFQTTNPILVADPVVCDMGLCGYT